MGSGRTLVQNRRARFSYEILETFEAGIALQGTEVKSIRDGKANIQEAYADIRDGEVFLVGAHISPYSHGSWTNHEPERPRRLLMHRSELNRLIGKVRQKGNTIVPIALYFKNGWAKVQIALVTNKTGADKRRTMKDRDAKRDLDRAKKWRR